MNDQSKASANVDEDTRRKFERKVHQDKCRLLVGETQTEYQAWMQDVSATGVRFRLMAPKLPRTGAMIQLPGMVGKATTLKIMRAEELGDNYFEYGARFTGIIEIEE